MEKFKAIWLILTSRYYVLFVTKDIDSKWTTIQGKLNYEQHKNIYQTIDDLVKTSISNNAETTTGNSANYSVTLSSRGGVV